MKKMANSQIPPDDGELKHMFTKTLTQDDLLHDLTLDGDSNDFLTTLPAATYNEIITGGLQVRMHPPSQRLVNIYYECESTSFRVQKDDWLAIVEENKFAVDDKIACWAATCHGQDGLFTLLIEKVPADVESGC